MDEEPGKYKSTLLARYFWAFAEDNSYELQITQLQKLLFIVYGVYLTITGERLVDEPVHAWPYGPVFPKVRKDFIKRNEYHDITIEDVEFAEIKKDTMLNLCIKSVLKEFGNWYASELINWTHRSGSAWTVTTQKLGFHWNDIIEDEDIKKDFKTFCTWKPKRVAQ